MVNVINMFLFTKISELTSVNEIGSDSTLVDL